MRLQHKTGKGLRRERNAYLGVKRTAHDTCLTMDRVLSLPLERSRRSKIHANSIYHMPLVSIATTLLLLCTVLFHFFSYHVATVLALFYLSKYVEGRPVAVLLVVQVFDRLRQQKHGSSDVVRKVWGEQFVIQKVVRTKATGFPPEARGVEPIQSTVTDDRG